MSNSILLAEYALDATLLEMTAGWEDLQADTDMAAPTPVIGESMQSNEEPLPTSDPSLLCTTPSIVSTAPSSTLLASDIEASDSMISGTTTYARFRQVMPSNTFRWPDVPIAKPVPEAQKAQFWSGRQRGTVGGVQYDGMRVQLWCQLPAMRPRLAECYRRMCDGYWDHAYAQIMASAGIQPAVANLSRYEEPATSPKAASTPPEGKGFPAQNATPNSVYRSQFPAPADRASFAVQHWSGPMPQPNQTPKPASRRPPPSPSSPNRPAPAESGEGCIASKKHRIVGPRSTPLRTSRLATSPALQHQPRPPPATLTSSPATSVLKRSTPPKSGESDITPKKLKVQDLRPTSSLTPQRWSGPITQPLQTPSPPTTTSTLATSSLERPSPPDLAQSDTPSTKHKTKISRPICKTCSWEVIDDRTKNDGVHCTRCCTRMIKNGGQVVLAAKQGETKSAEPSQNSRLAAAMSRMNSSPIRQEVAKGESAATLQRTAKSSITPAAPALNDVPSLTTSPATPLEWVDAHEDGAATSQPIVKSSSPAAPALIDVPSLAASPATASDSTLRTTCSEGPDKNSSSTPIFLQTTQGFDVDGSRGEEEEEKTADEDLDSTEALLRADLLDFLVSCEDQ